MPRGEPTKPIGIRLTEAEQEALKKRAEQEYRSSSSLAKLCFLDGLELRKQGKGRG